MTLPSLEDLMPYRVHIAILAIVICIFAWITDLAGWVYICPYCRAQRTIIGLLGLMLLFNPQHWLNRWASSCLAVFGLVVAAGQHFRGWAKIMAREFTWGEYWYANSWVLSGCALVIMTGLILYLWACHPPESEDDI